MKSLIILLLVSVQASAQWYNTPPPPNEFSHLIIFRGGYQGLDLDDVVGVAYSTAPGIYRISGAGKYEGGVFAVPAFGNDTLEQNKNGFVDTEPFRFFKYTASNQQVAPLDVKFYINTLFALNDSTPPVYITDSSRYRNDGISVVYDLCAEHRIEFKQGWNIISSYLDIDETLDAVYGSVDSNIILVKDVAGAVYFPAFGINLIGIWQYDQAYRVKAKRDFTLTLCKARLDSSINIFLPLPGWYLVPYLKQQSKDAALVFQSIAQDVIIVKGVGGTAYIPSLGINTIGDMVAGQGYAVKTLNGTILNYQ